MKKVLFFALSLIAVASMYSCGGDEPTPPPTPDPTYKLDVNKSNLSFASTDAPVQTITVTSENVKWESKVEESATSWLSIVTKDNTITVTVTNNTEEKTRSGKFSITPDTDKVTAKTITVTQAALEIIETIPAEIKMTTGLLQFYGNDYVPNIGHCTIYMGSEGSTVLENKEGVTIEHANGYIVTLDVMMTTPFGKEQYDNPELALGKYNISTKFTSASQEFEPMTFLKAFNANNSYYGSILSRVKNNATTKVHMLSDGTIEVARGTGDSYDITMNLKLSTGEDIKMTFNQKFDFVGYSPNSYTTLKEDQTISDYNKGDLVYYKGVKDVDENGMTVWIVEVSTPGLTIVNDKFVGSGFILDLQLYSPLVSPTNIVLPDGTYKIHNGFEEKHAAFSGMSGIADEEAGKLLASWLKELEENKTTLKNIGAILEGNVTIKHNSGDSYTIDIDCLLDNYKSYKAKFTVNLPVFDTSKKKSRFPAPGTTVNSINKIKPAYLQ